MSLNKKYWLCCGFLITVLAAHLLWWHCVDTRPPVWDASVHLNLASIYKDFLYTGKPMLSPWVSLWMPYISSTLKRRLPDLQVLRS